MPTMKSLVRLTIFLILGLLMAIALSSTAIPTYSATSITNQYTVGRNQHRSSSSQPDLKQRPTDPSQNASALGETSRLIGEMEQTWQEEYTTYFGVDIDAPPLTEPQITEALSRLGGQTAKRLALIYVFPRRRGLEVVLAIPGTEPMRETLSDVPLRTFRGAADALKIRVSRPNSRRQYLVPARQLYSWIIAPLESQLDSQNIDTLIFCVGSGLRSVPLAALYDGERFLVEKYNLGLIPAFSLTNARYNTVKNANILAMGASEFEGMPALPAVPLELSAITETIGQADVFLNQDFTLENLRQKLASEPFGIVHLATHAEFRPGAPENSYIQFWQNERLGLDQLRQFDWSKLPVELLVLSACRTAVGDRNAELGFAGLSFQSGVKSSLASLWYVSDLGTLAFMREFYWQLAQPEVTTKAEALKRAQVALLTGQVYVENNELHTSSGMLPLPENLQQGSAIDLSSPYYWAAFMLVGSPW